MVAISIDNADLNLAHGTATVTFTFSAPPPLGFTLDGTSAVGGTLSNLSQLNATFSGDVDTDIMFDYGIFTPNCRWADLSDIRELKMQISARRVPLSGEAVFPDWQTAMAKISAAIDAIQ